MQVPCAAKDWMPRCAVAGMQGWLAAGAAELQGVM